ncbi:hypothetical protein ACLESO_15910 [Pyxidicoccus sp. 3LG]
MNCFPLRAPALLAASLLLLSGCASARRVKAFPTKSIRLPELPHAVELVLPPPGEVVAARLADGSPVWVSRGSDDTVKVFSAFVPSEPEFSTVYMVSWVPTVRRFLTGLVWDEQGRVLGYSRYERCCGRCPDLDSYPEFARDLDAYQVTRLPGEPARVAVGPRVQGAERRLSREFFPSWLNEPRQRPPALSLQDALREPGGTVAYVEAYVVRVPGEPPVLCAQGDAPPLPCPPGAPRLYDVDGAPEPRDGDRSGLTYGGSLLLRRYRDGFVQYVVGGDLGPPNYGFVPPLPGP